MLFMSSKMTPTNETMKGRAQQLDAGGNLASLQISQDGGLVDLAAGHEDQQGFYLTVAPGGTEGLLMVSLKGSDPANKPAKRLMPFFFGWNPILITQVWTDAGNTAATIYWGK